MKTAADDFLGQDMPAGKVAKHEGTQDINFFSDSTQSLLGPAPEPMVVTPPATSSVPIDFFPAADSIAADVASYAASASYPGLPVLISATFNVGAPCGVSLSQNLVSFFATPLLFAIEIQNVDLPL